MAETSSDDDSENDSEEAQVLTTGGLKIANSIAGPFAINVDKPKESAIDEIDRLDFYPVMSYLRRPLSRHNLSVLLNCMPTGFIPDIEECVIDGFTKHKVKNLRGASKQSLQDAYDKLKSLKKHNYQCKSAKHTDDFIPVYPPHFTSMIEDDDVDPDTGTDCNGKPSDNIEVGFSHTTVAS